MKRLAVGLPTVAVQSSHSRVTQPELLVFVWVATLMVSALPAILSQELGIFQTISIDSLRIILLLALVITSFVWYTARPLRGYFLIFLALYAVDAFFDWLNTSAMWQSWFVSIDSSFTREMLRSQLLRLAVAVVMIAVVAVVHRPWLRFLLSKNDLNASAEPVPLLGIDRPIGWAKLGSILTICITLGTLLFLVLSGSPSGNALLIVVPILPVIFIVAALNAFSEEVTYRWSLLAPLYEVVGKRHALLLTAALFGLWHYYGVPYGIIGVVMAGALGWLLGKSMLETKGVFWAWFIHFWQDVAIFSFIAAGSVMPGG